MADIGYWSLALTLAVSLYAGTAFIVGRRRGYPELIQSAKNAVLAAAGLSTLASAALLYLLATHQFQVEYVYEHTASFQATVFNLSAFWAGQEGSLLLWLWLLSVLAVAVVWQQSSWLQPLKPYALATFAFTQAFFALLLLFESNPFKLLPEVPADGFGLNPLLLNLWMVIHPPVVFIGYAAYTAPFAFAIAALASGRLDNQWLRGIRRWSLVAWLFLGLGILLGAWWAYLELGWGGYWGWDPVENSSLIPWLTGTALLHSAMIQERREMFKVWNVTLIVATFALCVFATFVTRSGIIQSVHAFGKSNIGYYFMSFLVVVLIAFAVLAVRRQRGLAGKGRLEEVVSREAAFLLANLLFAGMALTVLLGTLYPALTELLSGQQTALGASFYERVIGPLALVTIVVIGVCPLLSWRRVKGDQLVRSLLIPTATAFVTALGLFAFGIREGFAIVSLSVCAFLTASTGAEFARGTAARMRSTGENPMLALIRLVGRARRRYGGYMVHLSIMLIMVGITGSSVYKSEWQVALAEGEQIAIGDYTLEYEGYVTERLPDKQRYAARLGVYCDGRKVSTLIAQKNYHWNQEQWVTEVAIHSNLKEDLYVILGGLDEGDGREELAIFEVVINPLVVWLWIGGGLMLVGAVIAWWPRQVASSK